MKMILYDKLTRFSKEIPVTAFPAIPNLLNKVIQLAIADFMVFPRYYLLNLTPPEALGMQHVPIPDVGYIDVKLIEMKIVENATTESNNQEEEDKKKNIDFNKVTPVVTYMWGIPSRTKKGKPGTYDPVSKSWKWKKGEGFCGQIAGGMIGDLVTFIVYW